MSDEWLIQYKTYTIHLVSYRRRDGQWVPLALVSSPTASDEQSYPVADEESLWQTKAGANAVAKKLAIEWIDSQFPTAAD